LVKFNEIKLSYTCSAYPPEGIYMDKLYRIIKKEDKFYFTDGVVEFEGNEQYIKMLFSPNSEVKWEDVDFKDETKEITKEFYKSIK